ncbi:MAG TPA: sigma-70 family RNA polymerase sigma factor [Vicinamibacterales bacterium]|nr:sigma-70 family RNA polymerase sigma factor [Vicinamibacterales bacterium]
MPHLDSTVLVERARAGSADALNELYARYGRRLLGLIRLRMGRGLRDRLDSGDILQATLLRSFERIGQFRGEAGGSFMAWLARIAENEIRDRADFHGRQRREAARAVPIEAAGQAVTSHVRTAVSQLIADEEAARLERVLDTLEAAHREVILLRKFEELSWGEIAARMDRTEDACRMLLTRAMVALTWRMKEGQ